MVGNNLRVVCGITACVVGIRAQGSVTFNTVQYLIDIVRAFSSLLPLPKHDVVITPFKRDNNNC